jgi:hypothetical protein
LRCSLTFDDTLAETGGGPSFIFAVSYNLDGSQRDSIISPDVVGRIEAVELHLTSTAVYISGITYGSVFKSKADKAQSTNLVTVNNVVITCGASAFYTECMDVFVIRLNPNSLATAPKVWQIGPANDPVNNNADEAIGALACGQNVPSLAASSC